MEIIKTTDSDKLTVYHVGQISTDGDERPFLYDKITKTWSLMDSGAQVNLWPKPEGAVEDKSVVLIGANKKRIPAYGVAEKTVRFGRYKKYKTQVIYADISKAILGDRFLREHKLVYDSDAGTIFDKVSKQTYQTRIKQFCTEIEAAEVEEKQKFPEFINEHYPELLKHDFTAEQPKNGVQHRIITQGPPIKCKPRAIYGEKEASGKAAWFELVKWGILERAESQWASPLHLEKKPDGTWRVCSDFRRLNSVTETSQYPLPNIHSFTKVASKANIFSKVDLKKAFHLISIAPEDRPKTATTTPWGLFQYRRLPMGLTNAAQAFQMLVDEATEGLDRTFAYLDDILIASESEEQHLQDLHNLAKRLSDMGLMIAQNKCLFGVEELTFLGFHVTTTGITPLPERVKAIQEYPTPQTVKQLQAFLGMVNYYRHMCPRAAQTLGKLYEATKLAPKAFKWTPELDSAFAKGKKMLANATELVHPDPSREIRVTTDASDTGYGAVLEQQNPATAQWEPLIFFSKKFQPNQTLWAPYDKELHGVWMSLRKFHGWINGRNPTVRTDHQSILNGTASNVEPFTPERYRKLAEIAATAGTIDHLAGELNTVADTLSRIQSEAHQEKLKDEAEPGLVDAVTCEVLDWVEMAREQEKCTVTQEFIKSEKRQKSSIDLKLVPITGQCSMWADVTYGRRRPVVPVSFRKKVFSAVHDLKHPGADRTTKMVTDRYLWPGMRKELHMSSQPFPPRQANNTASRKRSVPRPIP